MESEKNNEYVELSDDQLDSVVGGFIEGDKVRLKTGRMHCAKCGMKGINTFTYLGMSGSGLARVRLSCGHVAYIPARELTE